MNCIYVRIAPIPFEQNKQIVRGNTEYETIYYKTGRSTYEVKKCTWEDKHKILEYSWKKDK